MVVVVVASAWNILFPSGWRALETVFRLFVRWQVTATAAGAVVVAFVVFPPWEEDPSREYLCVLNSLEIMDDDEGRWWWFKHAHTHTNTLEPRTIHSSLARQTMVHLTEPYLEWLLMFPCSPHPGRGSIQPEWDSPLFFCTHSKQASNNIKIMDSMDHHDQNKHSAKPVRRESADTETEVPKKNQVKLLRNVIANTLKHP